MKILLHKIRKNRGTILLLLLLAAFYLTFGCPIRLFSGVSCPGCGMTRAIFALAKLDFATAFEMHPLVFLLPIAALVFLIRGLIPKKLMNALCVLALTLLLVVYIIRMSSPSDVVYADFESGLVYKLFYKISQLNIF